MKMFNLSVIPKKVAGTTLSKNLNDSTKPVITALKSDTGIAINQSLLLQANYYIFLIIMFTNRSDVC